MMMLLIFTEMISRHFWEILPYLWKFNFGSAWNKTRRRDSPVLQCARTWVLHACLLSHCKHINSAAVHYSCHVLLTTPVENIESETCSSCPLERVNLKLPGIAFRDSQWKCLCCDIVVCVPWPGALLILIGAESMIAGCLVGELHVHVHAYNVIAMLYCWCTWFVCYMGFSSNHCIVYVRYSTCSSLRCIIGNFVILLVIFTVKFTPKWCLLLQ